MKIIVVEDSERVRDLLLQRLAREPGLDVLGHARGEDEAVFMIQSRQPDVVVLDLALSPGSGLNVLKRLREAGVFTRVAVFTNQPASLYRQVCLDAGANAYFDKSAEVDALVARLLAWQPPVPANEAARVGALHALHILDSPEEEPFDAITRLAARLTGAPIALISLLDSDRQWFKARFGLEMRESKRSLAFCAHVVNEAKLLVVEDAREDARFSDNPMVMNAPGVCFYAGMPLVLTGGEAVGTLCVIDTTPRRLTDTQRMALEVLASSVVAEMELRRRVTDLESEVLRRQEAELRIMHLATRDPLTGLPNRAALMDRLSQGIRLAARERSQLAVLFMDLDRFKWVNDTLGHDAGDALLQSTAERLVHTLRGSDTVARLGGDEFAVILSLPHGQADVESIAGKLIAAVQEPFQLGTHQVQVGCSIGIVLYPEQGETEESLLRHADLAMYQAKELGGNRACVYSDQLNQRAMERVTLESELRQAIVGGELVLHYQPQVNLADGRLAGLEALVRWNHPRLGLLMPDRFISLAEDSGLIWPLGLFVLDAAVAQIAEWSQRGYAVPRVAVNISPAQLRETLPDAVIDTLERHAVPASRLELELTETALTSDGPAVLELMHRLRDRGIAIAIDDFGVGYSSLALLRRLPITALKIDRSFVSDVASNKQDVAIVEAVITMAKSMGLRTVAEGVEQQAQHVALRVLGCDDSQGYLYDRPMPADQVASWMRPATLSAALDAERARVG
ncbi:MAG: response regulator receiver protein [Hydrogenophilales bacterium 16-64-46]|nr:MAG: response regulator receiver protein [Hydrogenophilales bacterium 12-64-13]OYZ06326.1 MAG: response regulator receiver protein [Hydrogenophilales bacterium 16-64-46]OZA38775.1 MAG: response regulator receiver protein [Hydrogenophilales bacterium 17-64-34]HQS99599.1 EAL domain-containing protein [Thiobacillus sp.]